MIAKSQHGTPWLQHLLNVYQLGIVSLVVLTGCTTISFPLGPSTSPPGYQFLTGNWEITITPTSGINQFGVLRGFVNEQSVNAGVDDPVTASLQIGAPSTCFLGTIVLPLAGSLQANALTLTSFTDVYQFVSITATKDSAATHLTGTYQVGGGCASGSQGTVSGVRFMPLTGTYAGVATGNVATELSLSLTQSLVGNGNGSLNETGFATFTGSSCYTTGTLSAAQSYVVGSLFHLVFETSDGSQVTVAGNFDPPAQSMTASSISTIGGACSGKTGAAALTLQ